MATVDFAFLCQLARTDPDGLVSALGIGISRVEILELPFQFALMLVTKVDWEEQELNAAHLFRVIVDHEDGEKLVDMQGGMQPVSEGRVSHRLPLGMTTALPLALVIRRPGMYAVRVSVDGDELKVLPLEVVTGLPQA